MTRITKKCVDNENNHYSNIKLGRNDTTKQIIHQSDVVCSLDYSQVKHPLNKQLDCSQPFEPAVLHFNHMMNEETIQPSRHLQTNP